MLTRGACWTCFAIIGLLFSAIGWPGFGQEPPKKEDAAKARFVVEAQVIVIKKSHEDLPLSNNMESQAVVVRSDLVIERAIEKSNLKVLKTLKNAEAPSFISSNLKVKVSNKASNILELAYECTDAEEGAQILQAIIESYTGFLGLTCDIRWDQRLKSLEREYDVMKEELEKKNEDYRKFVIANPDISRNGLADQQMAVYTAQFLQLQVSLKTLQADREWVKQLGGDNLSVQLAARKWAKEAGYDAGDKKVQELVQIYARYLEDEIVRTQLRMSAIKEMKVEAAKLDAIKVEASKLREDAAKANKELERIDLLVNEALRARQADGFDAVVLSKPHAKEIGKAAPTK